MGPHCRQRPRGSCTQVSLREEGVWTSQPDQPRVSAPARAGWPLALELILLHPPQECECALERTRALG